MYYNIIQINILPDQAAIDLFIECVTKISDAINSDNWNGEDVMEIFFNTFNRYRGKLGNGQVFTPDHITSLMYRLINIHQDDVVFDGACGSGSFLTKSMGNMIQEAGGMSTNKAKIIKSHQLYGIEIDSISGRIARQLYQNANIVINGYEKTELPDSFFDVSIGNVPFGDFKLNDKRYDKNNFLIHDYFFRKNFR